MKINWQEFIGRVLNITLFENYGVVYNQKDDVSPAFYEIVFKTGKLTQAFDDGLLLESKRDEQIYKIFVPYASIKCVEIF